MNTKIKKILLGVAVLILVGLVSTFFVLKSRAKKLQIPVVSTALQNQLANVQTDQSPTDALVTTGAPAPIDPINAAQKNAPSANSKNAIGTSANDILKEVKNPVDCGQACTDDASCKAVNDCLFAHATDCSAANGRIIYPIRNSDKKKAIEHIIVGKEGGKCVYKGVTTGVESKLDTAAAHSYECKVSTESFKQVFADPATATQFIRENCSGTYVDFLKTPRDTAPTDGSVKN